MLKAIFRSFFVYAFYAYSLISWTVVWAAYNRQPSGLGGVARNMTSGPVSFASTFLNAGCFVIGSSFLFASVVKYNEHRRSPLMVPISTVVFLLIAGLILVGIPILTSDYVSRLLH
jgi:hypothetical protein